MLKIAPSDSLLDKLKSISDLNDWLVLDDKVCEPSTSSYRINLSNNLSNNKLNFIKIWPEKPLFLRSGLGSSSIIWDLH